jgi:hypothetical protein
MLGKMGNDAMLKLEDWMASGRSERSAECCVVGRSEERKYEPLRRTLE